MKIKNLLMGLSFATGLVAGLHFLHAQGTGAGDSPNGFSLTLTGVSNGWVYLNLNNTSSSSNYTLLYKQSLGAPSWSTAGTVTGALNQNWTAVMMPTNGPSLFVWALANSNSVSGGNTNGGTGTTGYGSNLWLNMTVSGTSSNRVANLAMMNTAPDILYELQASTNLAQGNWFSLGFVDGSELTNMTAMSALALNRGMPQLFLRIRSWQDSTGTGIPDWWWLEYFGQTTNVDASASAAGDGFSNAQKFQLGLNPTNYYAPNPVGGFFGCLDVTGTNVILEWSNAPGPVIGYALARGNYISGNTFTSLATVSSNINFYEDVGANTNNAAHNYAYTITALYPGGLATPTNIWYWGHNVPTPGSIYAYADATGTNVLLSWTPAPGPATNYLVEHGVYTTTNGYVFTPVSLAGVNATNYEVTGALTNAGNWGDEYGVVAVFPGGGLSTLTPNSWFPIGISPLNVGSTNGPAAPGNFYGYADSTGTNVYLNWDAVPGAVTNYLLYGGNYNYNSDYEVYTPLGKIGPGTNSFEVAGNPYALYAVVAAYSSTNLSQAAEWNAGSGTSGPGMLVAYVDWTGTNIMLAWSPVPGATGYAIEKSYDSGADYSQIGSVGSGTSTFEDVGGNSGGLSGIMYQVQATYPNGGLSAAVSTSVATDPPAPSNLSMSVSGANAVLTWTAVLTPGVSYTIERGVYNQATGTYSYSQIGQTSATTFTDMGAISGANSYNNVYQVIANYPGGQTSTPEELAVSQSVTPPAGTSTADLSVTVQLVRNQTGHWQLMFGEIPADVQTIALDWWGWDYYYFLFSPFPDPGLGYPFNIEAEIPASALTNGIYVIPDYMTTNGFPDNIEGKIAMIQAIGTNNARGSQIQVNLLPLDAPCFVDGRQHLLQNMLYQLRAATISQPNAPLSESDIWWNPSFVTFGIPTDSNYVESSIFHLSEQFNGFGNGTPTYFVKMDDLWPFTANYELHQNLYDPNYNGPSSFVWQTNLVTIPTPAILGIGDPYWTLQNFNNLADVGAYTSGGNLYLESGVDNLFGLPFTTALVNNGSPIVTLNPGSSVGMTNVNSFFSQTVDPVLRLTNHYFAPVNTPGTTLPNGTTPNQTYPLPCLTGFANTNQTPIMIASVGTPTVIGGWGRFAIENGNPNKYAYLGQYFETNAYLLDADGNVTTNTTGVVSPYGDFFPTEPGSEAMITMPDYNNDPQGTGVVHVIALDTDANHDGTMDFSYFGPDFTSPYRPFRFWVDDSTDSGDDGGNGIPGQGAKGNGVRPLAPNGQYGIHGRRDLVNFFPVYVNIANLFENNAISATDTNWQFVLSQADGALRFVYTDLTTNNYMNFLHDITETSVLANEQTTTITKDGVVLGSWFFQNMLEFNQGIILVQAWTNTTQPLVLTIYHGSNEIAQTSLYLNISGVEQMFRHKNLMLNPNDTAPPDRLTDASVPNEPETIDKNFVFVHGYNVNTNEARGVAADVFKRMYWSGSHARFYAVTWEGADSQLEVLGKILFTPNYHSNVVNAFLTAPAFAQFVATLTNGPVVVAAHSLGNMVVLDALDEYSAPISQYFMLDAAVPMEAVDPSTGNNIYMVDSAWQAYSNRLYAANWYKLWTNLDYRSLLTWSGRLTNFNGTQVYNFYSSGEEVLREWDVDPPTNVVSAAAQIVEDYAVNQAPASSYVWVWQEKAKGISASDSLLGSTHGGWKFNASYAGLTVAQADALPNSELQTNAFFDLTSPSFGDADLELYGGLGDYYAEQNRNRILSDAIPALSLPVGANPVPALSTPTQRNFDMQALYENGWPLGRAGNPAEANKWHHSDFHEVAYTFTYQLFDKLVTTGNLK